jgi:hypothetical protein
MSKHCENGSQLSTFPDKNDSVTVHPDAPFPDRDELIAYHLARGATREEAATAANCCRRVVYNRLTDPEFKLLVGEYRKAMIDESVGKLAMVAGRAVEVLTAALDDERATIRVRAATTLLDALLRVRAHMELDERLTQLERRLTRSKERYR